MKKLIITIGLAAVFSFIASFALSASNEGIAGNQSGTPHFLPFISKPHNTPTSTPTATATATPPPTATHTAVPPTATYTAVPPTATYTAVPPTATATQAPPTSAAPANVRVAFILYNPPGDDVPGEYVRIDNNGGTAAILSGWTLRDESQHVFTFPGGFVLPPAASVRVWTKTGTNTQTDVYYNSGSAIWNNTGDTATLRNATNQNVSVCSYAGGGESYTCP